MASNWLIILCSSLIGSKLASPFVPDNPFIFETPIDFVISNGSAVSL